MCEDVYPQWQIHQTSHGDFGIVVKFPDYCQAEIKAFQKQMLESRWLMDEAEL